MSSQNGSVTIEAAITIPFVIFVFAFMLFMIKVEFIKYYIHNNVIMATHETALEVYAIDKTGLVDKSQRIFQAGDTSLNSTIATINTAKDSASSIYYGGLDIISKNSSLYRNCENLVKSEDFLSFAKNSYELADDFKNKKDELISNTKNITDALNYFITNAKTIVTSPLKAYAVIYANNAIAEGFINSKFHSLVGKDKLRSIGVEDLSFDNCHIMLPDDTIDISYKYKIRVPFLTNIFGKYIRVYGSSLARAYTGSYDTNDIKAKKKNDNDKYFYIALTSEGNHSYHLLSCLRKPVIRGSSTDVFLKGRLVCKYCKANYTQSSQVYYTSDSSKVHFKQYCPKIYSEKIERITEEEAIERGYDPCDKKGCVTDSGY